MHIQIVEFELQGLGRGDYEAQCDQLAPAFADLPGLVSKQWIIDPDTNRAGGVYMWADREACDAYVAGPMFSAVRANPVFANVRTRRYDLLARPSAVTCGTTPAVPGLR